MFNSQSIRVSGRKNRFQFSPRSAMALKQKAFQQRNKAFLAREFCQSGLQILYIFQVKLFFKTGNTKFVGIQISQVVFETLRVGKLLAKRNFNSENRSQNTIQLSINEVRSFKAKNLGSSARILPVRFINPAHFSSQAAFQNANTKFVEIEISQVILEIVGVRKLSKKHVGANERS